MTVSPVQTRRIEVIQHPTLINFNAEFGTDSDLSRYENIRTPIRATSSEVLYLNQLQMGSYIPTNKALLLKNNLHDAPFITFTTRSILYELKQYGKISEACFTFLHEKLNKSDFTTVFRYLYIIMLYTQIAKRHDKETSDPILFRFESSSSYSEKLVKAPFYTIQKEEQSLQQQYRNQFMRQWLAEIGARAECPRDAQREIFSVLADIDSSDHEQFRSHFLILLEKLQAAPELEKICWQEFQSTLTPFQGRDFFDQVYLCLSTESYYKNCLSRVVTLRESLERTEGDGLLAISEKCKKAYNGCTYLLGDSKNMPACSTIRFAALTGKMRTEWQTINNTFNRAQQQFAHRLCACQAQSPPSQNEMADWPYNTHTLIPLKPAQPITSEQLQQRGIDAAEYQANQEKTVAFIGCEWGGGHIEVTRGLSNNLSSLGYHPVSINLPQLLISEDPIQNLTITRLLGKKWSVGCLFDGLLKEKAFASIDFLRWFKQKYFSSPLSYTDSSLKLVLEQLLKINPNSVVVTYSNHNEVVIKACEILGIPCMHIATDIDTTIETRDKPTDYKHFKMAIPFDAPETVNPILSTTTPEQRFVSGPPIRHEFTVQRSEEDIRRLKQAWGIDLNKKVVVISSGKAGAFSPYPEVLAAKYANAKPEEIPIHVVVLCGKTNHTFKRHLEQNILQKTKLPMTVELYTDKMEELISMASYGGVVVGKGGGGTIFESLSRGVRILIDNGRPSWFSQGVKHFLITALEMLLRKFGFKSQLSWEKVNTNFAKSKGIADVFKHVNEFLPKLEQMLNNDNRPVQTNLEVRNAEKEIPRVLREMLNKAENDPNSLRAREVHTNL